VQWQALKFLRHFRLSARNTAATLLAGFFNASACRSGCIALRPTVNLQFFILQFEFTTADAADQG